MLVSDIARRIRSMAGDQAGTLVDDNDIFDLINDAMLELNMEAKILQFGNVGVMTPEVQAYNYAATDLISITYMFIAEASDLNAIYIPQISANEIRHYNPAWAELSNVGKPRYYMVEGNKIRFYPTPDLAYIYGYGYLQVPTAVSSMSTVPALPAYMHPLIARMAFALVKEKDEDFEAAQVIKAEVLMKVLQMQEMVKSTGDSYPVVRDDSAPIHGTFYLD